MAQFEINKGVGRSVEFKGLKSQYLFVFAGGLLGVFLLVVILYLFGVSQFLCLSLGLLGGTLIVWKTFSLNKKYGEHGIMKLAAKKSHPHYLINRKRIRSLLGKGGDQ